MSAHNLLASGDVVVFGCAANDMSAFAVNPVIFKRHPLPWRLVTQGQSVKLDRKDRLKRVFLAVDSCLVDRDGYEVLAAQGYLRVDHEVMELIVARVNGETTNGH